MSDDRATEAKAGTDELGQRLVQDLVDVGRRESTRLRDDVVGDVRPATTGVVLLVAAGAAGVLAAAAASTAMLRMLELVLPRRLAALALTTGYAAGTAMLLRLGLGQLSAAGGGSRRLADGVREGISAARQSAEATASSHPNR